MNNGEMVLPVYSIGWAIANSELLPMLKTHNADYKSVSITSKDLSRTPLWQLIALSLGGTALVAFLIGFLIWQNRRTRAAIPSLTQIVDRIQQRPETAALPRKEPSNQRDDSGKKVEPVTHAAQNRLPEPTAPIWEVRVSGPQGFTLTLRLTTLDFVRAGGRIILGRSREFCDIHIQDDSISRQQLQFELHQETLCVADRNSSNGTKINQRPLGDTFKAHPLQNGDTIQFGAMTGVVRKC